MVATLTFDGLQNFEQIGDYYDGGTGSLGSGPGPDEGITFSSDALAYMRGVQSGSPNPFPGQPSPAVLLVFNTGNPYNAGYPTSITMDVSQGFTQALCFYYIAIGREGLVSVYSGPDGTGAVLATQALATTLESFTGPMTVSFAGVAESVVFTGGNDQMALDNITIQTVPEPAGWISLTLHLAAFALLFVMIRNTHHATAIDSSPALGFNVSAGTRVLTRIDGLSGRCSTRGSKIVRS